MRRVLALGSAALSLGACGAQAEPPTAEPRRYVADAMVLEERGEGPWLCVGIVLDSLPPQCGDAPLDGWDWDAVEGEETMSGTTWGDYRVVGTYDGDRFAVEEVLPPTPPPTESDYEPTPSPCEDPEGGWLAQLPGTGTREAASRYAERQPEHVRTWVTWLEPDADFENDSYLLNVVFSARAAEHEAALRERWGGPLCVVERDDPTARELGQIRREAERTLDELGVRWVGSAAGGREARVELEILADVTGEAQRLFDERYGAGVVLLVPLLEPVD